MTIACFEILSSSDLARRCRQFFLLLAFSGKTKRRNEQSIWRFKSMKKSRAHKKKRIGADWKAQETAAKNFKLAPRSLFNCKLFSFKRFHVVVISPVCCEFFISINTARKKSVEQIFKWEIYTEAFCPGEQRKTWFSVQSDLSILLGVNDKRWTWKKMLCTLNICVAEMLEWKAGGDWSDSNESRRCR